MDNEIFKKFTPNLKKILVLAEQIAAERNTGQNTEHQLLAILQNRETLASEILANYKIAADRIDLVSTLVAHNSQRATEIITTDAKKAIQFAVQSASKYHHLSIGSEHLLLALLSDKTFNSYLIIERLGADPKKIKKQVEQIFAGIEKSFENKNEAKVQNMPIMPENLMADEGFDDAMFGPIQPFTQPVSPAKAESILDQFSTNLTKLAKNRRLDPVIGRDKEIARLIQTLSRRTKNNPILVGEPGVGKTAIVEGLAQRIASGNVPEKLANTEIMSLDLGSILAGTMYRGQFESRIKKILAEIEKKGNIILFVDEIHMMVGAGSTEGSIDAANLLKPMLAKGQLRLIGSTTFDEYKKHIEKDAAFERRFQPIYVLEPSKAETLKILQGIKTRYEEYHHVAYLDEALLAAAELSARYINDRNLPDKAIDLIDEAGAAKAVTHKSKSQTKVLQNKLRRLLAEKDELIAVENYEKAAKLREQELKLEQEIESANFANEKIEKSTISANDIAQTVSNWTGIPATAMSSTEKKSFLNLERRMKKYILGQDEAINELASAIKRSRTGIANPLRPIGSFIFLGPTGVGKTELTKVLAREVFGSDKALIKIDMSEFAEKHNVARLVGAPAGYVGFEEGGKLTERVRKNPYSVILFDEIEKAHPEIFNILLQILEDGTLTDAKGRSVDFKNTIVIMTSNLGTDILRRQASIGFGENTVRSNYEKMRDNVIETIEKTFRPEFLNRLDKIIVFSPLEQKTLRKIVDLQLAGLITRLKNQDYDLKIGEGVADWIAQKSYKPEFGARPIRKYIADNIEPLLSDAILADDRKSFKLELKDNKLALQ